MVLAVFVLMVLAVFDGALACTCICSCMHVHAGAGGAKAKPKPPRFGAFAPARALALYRVWGMRVQGASAQGKRVHAHGG